MRISEDFVGVLFDVDGVLLDSMTAHVESWVRAGQELGLEIPEHEVYLREGEKSERTARDFIKAAGLMTTKKRIQMLIDKKAEIYMRLSTAPRPFPGVGALLESLVNAGMLVGFVTGTSRAEIQEAMPGEFEPYFKASVCGDEVMHGKPNPEPYMAGMRILGVAPRECLVIENAPLGIQSALTAGATVWAVRSYLGDEHLPAGVHGKVDRIADLMEFV
ncbi:HAD family phosphatase [bacterium]|nr:HAD family phosphatase [bacterium]